MKVVIRIRYIYIYSFFCKGLGYTYSFENCKGGIHKKCMFSTATSSVLGITVRISYGVQNSNKCSTNLLFKLKINNKTF